MGFFDSLKQMGKDVSNKLSNEVTKFKNKDFLNAVIAGCALVAASDGNVSPEEKRKMLGFINNSDALKVFNSDEVIESFNKITSKFEFDYEIGKAEALKIVAKLKSNVDAAKLMVRVCCVIGASDGNFDQHEKQTVRIICRELGLEPSEFDL
ncbi:MAG TPA: tellurite resistance TerB family protein [Agitococcus sp.]|nr:tellurite resistance TerB family protein [Agitococcus sp.]